MKIKKIIPFLLLLSLILCSLSILACSEKSGDGKKEDEEKSTEAETAGDTSAPDPRLAVSDDLPKKNYEGYEFSILYPEWGMYSGGFYFAESEIGEKFNDALYFRQKNVEDRFNVKIKTVTPGFQDQDTIHIAEFIKKSILAGDDAYDMALTHCFYGQPELASMGYVLDFNKLPGINLAKPWWNKTMNETLSVGGALPFAVSDYVIAEPNVIYFNKTMQKDEGIEDPYTLVKNGRWTLDKLVELSKKASKDLNGDGGYDGSDQYGLLLEQDWMLISFMFASGVNITEQHEGDPYPTLAMNSPKMTSVVEKIYNMIYEGSQTFTYKIGERDVSPVRFRDGKALFVIEPLNTAIMYRAVDVDFGILPFPKFDEAQEKYINNSWNGYMCVPSIASDPERTGIILEALAAESYKYTIPAYFDTLLNTKLSRDEQSVEMLQLVYDGCIYDAGLCYSEGNTLLYTIPILMNNKSKDFVSFYEKNYKPFENHLQKTYEAIIEKYSS